ncbi:manganese/iron ABC transporter ATP-binding protein [Bosea sp. (in: a-proteobacteria)]|uniref:manganese/iron ABC transporter ATP-binding protein n=1 Tax=Bosea sp. (in: a-proteobacteria) TaxID=1871050 RepID=UPI0025C2D4B1|nr:manganese/iron ABC transporter ATP-binding protein [Bosea sp. (in: a-proteobacteria)]
MHRPIAPRLAAEGAPSITVEGVTVSYANGVTAVNDASFGLGPGTICALVGINGSGKSTIFKTLMGFLKPAAGLVRIAGLEVRRALKRGLVAYVPQAEEVDWTFPVLVEDVVMMGRYGHMGFLRLPRKADREAVEQALARVNMLDFRRRQIGELSGGQRKRVFLARALAQGGQVILLDEPFTGVDVKTEDQIVSLMRELRAEGRLMLVSTHNLGSIPEFCDQVVIINKTVLAAGPTETTFTQENLQRAFGGALRHFRLEGTALHDDADARRITVLTDDERPLVLYGERDHEKLASGSTDDKP